MAEVAGVSDAASGEWERDRVAALREFGILDTDEDPDLQAIARLAARICQVPNATINLIDADRQWQAATEGFERGEVPREQSMCSVVLREPSTVVVPDASQDERFAANPWVDGELGDVRFYAASHLRTGDGYPLGTLCVYADTPGSLTAAQQRALDELAGQVMQQLELRRRTRMLADAVLELQRSNADLAAFAGRVAHDLRGPLTVVTGFLGLVERRFSGGLEPVAASAIESALASAKRMAEMLEGLLVYATVGARPVLAEVALRDVAAAVVADLSAAAEAAGGRVVVEALPVVRTDPTLVRQLLQNLVGNALKFTRSGVAPVVVVRGEGGGDSWCLDVADNGPGIPVEERERVFELFARTATAAGTPGTGIGLATCARVAEALGGALEISDTPGGGATFRLTVTP